MNLFNFTTSSKPSKAADSAEAVSPDSRLTPLTSQTPDLSNSPPMAESSPSARRDPIMTPLSSIGHGVNGIQTTTPARSMVEVVSTPETGRIVENPLTNPFNPKRFISKLATNTWGPMMAAPRHGRPFLPSPKPTPTDPNEVHKEFMANLSFDNLDELRAKIGTVEATIGAIQETAPLPKPVKSIAQSASNSDTFAIEPAAAAVVFPAGRMMENPVGAISDLESTTTSKVAVDATLPAPLTRASIISKYDGPETLEHPKPSTLLAAPLTSDQVNASSSSSSDLVEQAQLGEHEPSTEDTYMEDSPLNESVVEDSPLQKFPVEDSIIDEFSSTPVVEAVTTAIVTSPIPASTSFEQEKEPQPNYDSLVGAASLIKPTVDISSTVHITNTLSTLSTPAMHGLITPPASNELGSRDQLLGDKTITNLDVQTGLPPLNHSLASITPAETVNDDDDDDSLSEISDLEDPFDESPPQSSSDLEWNVVKGSKFAEVAEDDPKYRPKNSIMDRDMDQVLANVRGGTRSGRTFHVNTASFGSAKSKFLSTPTPAPKVPKSKKPAAQRSSPSASSSKRAARRGTSSVRQTRPSKKVMTVAPVPPEPSEGLAPSQPNHFGKPSKKRTREKTDDATSAGPSAKKARTNEQVASVTEVDESSTSEAGSISQSVPPFALTPPADEPSLPAAATSKTKNSQSGRPQPALPSPETAAPVLPKKRKAVSSSVESEPAPVAKKLRARKAAVKADTSAPATRKVIKARWTRLYEAQSVDAPPEGTPEYDRYIKKLRSNLHKNTGVPASKYFLDYAGRRAVQDYNEDFPNGSGPSVFPGPSVATATPALDPKERINFFGYGVAMAGFYMNKWYPSIALNGDIHLGFLKDWIFLTGDKDDTMHGNKQAKQKIVRNNTHGLQDVPKDFLVDGVYGCIAHPSVEDFNKMRERLKNDPSMKLVELDVLNIDNNTTEKCWVAVGELEETDLHQCGWSAVKNDIELWYRLHEVRGILQKYLVPLEYIHAFSSWVPSDVHMSRARGLPEDFPWGTSDDYNRDWQYFAI